MPENQSYEEKAEAIRDAAREVSGQGDDYKNAMRDLSAEKGVGEKHDKAIKEFESQRKELERSEKIGAFQSGVREAVKQWLDDNRHELIKVIREVEVE